MLSAPRSMGVPHVPVITLPVTVQPVDVPSSIAIPMPPLAVDFSVLPVMAARCVLTT